MVVALQLAALVAAAVALAAAVVALAAAVAVAVAWVPLKVRPVSALECSLGQALERQALERRRQAALHRHYLVFPGQAFREDSSSDLMPDPALQLAPELLLEEQEQAVTASAGSPSVVALQQLRAEEALLWLLADYSLALAAFELFSPVHSPFEPLLLFSPVH